MSDKLRVGFAGAGATSQYHLVGWSYQACFSAAVREFVTGIRIGRPFPTDRLDNLETLKLMEACYIAAGVRV